MTDFPATFVIRSEVQFCILEIICERLQISQSITRVAPVFHILFGFSCFLGIFSRWVGSPKL